MLGFRKQYLFNDIMIIIDGNLISIYHNKIGWYVQCQQVINNNCIPIFIVFFRIIQKVIGFKGMTLMSYNLYLFKHKNTGKLY